MSYYKCMRMMSIDVEMTLNMNVNLSLFKVLEYPFKQNRSILKRMTMLLYTHFFNISLNVLRSTFFNICKLPFLRSPNMGKIRVNVGPKTNYFSYFRAPAPTEL